MDEKINALRNEAATFQELAVNMIALAYRLDAATGEDTVRSMNTLAEAFRGELFNLQTLLDKFAD